MASRKISIMHVRDSSGIFGAERVILTLGKNIDRERFDFKLLCMRRRDGRSEKLIQFAQNLGIEVHTVNIDNRFDAFAFKRIREVFSKNDIHIIHSHDFKSDFYSLIASTRLNLRRVTTAHGSTRDSMLKRFYLFWDEKILYRMFDRIVAVSKNLKYFLVSRGVSGSKTRVIQNGLDFDLLQAENVSNEASIVIPCGCKVFAVIGRLYPDKGHLYFLKAFLEVVKSHPEVYGIIVGDGPAKDAIVDDIRKLKLEKQVQMCGVRSDIQAVYEQIDCLVISSLTEGLPYVLLEAMANRVPVVATAVGDIPKLIEDRLTGHLVPAEDSAALAERMIEIIANPETARELAENAYCIVVERYSAERMVRETERLYLELMSESREGVR